MKINKAFTPLEKTVREQSSLTGFTLIELAAVIGAFVVMVMILTPVVQMTKERSHRIDCANNLRLISLGLHLYATDHDEGFPPALGALYPDYVKSDKTFDCPANKIAGTPDNPDYEYVAGLKERSSNNEGIVYDPDNSHKAKGKNILRINGSVEWVNQAVGKPR